MANGGRGDAVITIKAERTEWLLHPLAGNESCCIFRVPRCLAEIHPKTYQPHIVSIGPYHYGYQDLQMMQEHKQRYLRDLLARTESTGLKLDDYLQAVASREQDVRDCYSENIKFGKNHLVEIMVLDGLFIIELFCREFGLVSLPLSHGDDPIFNLAWVKPNIIRDLLRLENQIPFFVLEILFEIFKAASSLKDKQLSFSELAFEFIGYAVKRPKEVSNWCFKAKHLLDLVRLSFTPQPRNHASNSTQDKKLNHTPSLLLSVAPATAPVQSIKSKTWEAVTKLLAGLKPKAAEKASEESASLEGEPVQLIKSARKLYKCGIKFRKVAATSFLDISFRHGVLKIPNLLIDDLLADLILNFVAFEQYHYWHCSSRHMTSYAAFMSFLIRTPEDATFLRDRDIIDNYLGTDEEVSNFFRSLGKDVTINTGEGHLCELFRDVNKYQKNVRHVTWGEFKFKYFDSPWSFLSALAAVIVLLLTILQTFFAVYDSSRPQKST